MTCVIIEWEVVYSPESPPNVKTHGIQPEESGQKEEMHADG